eukprot:6182914-Pleurochrysis_carterae.AAC.1
MGLAAHTGQIQVSAMRASCLSAWVRGRVSTCVCACLPERACLRARVRARARVCARASVDIFARVRAAACACAHACRSDLSVCASLRRWASGRAD